MMMMIFSLPSVSSVVKPPRFMARYGGFGAVSCLYIAPWLYLGNGKDDDDDFLSALCVLCGKIFAALDTPPQPLYNNHTLRA